MSDPPRWSLLPSTPADGVPPLLVSFEPGSAEYTVRVTDLAHVWIETLDRRSICRRAWDSNTSIDPSETPANMSKFLDSLNMALNTSATGHELTSLILKPSAEESQGNDGLIIRIICEIPGLAALKWNLQLKKAPSSTIATAIVLPLLQAQSSRLKELEDLVLLMRQKDGVMTKLVDKLEATGTGLENVFTSLSGRKKVSRASAALKVKGLEPFVESEWRAGAANSPEGPTDVVSLMTLAFKGDALGNRGSAKADDSLLLDDWWLHFTATQEIPLRSRNKAATIVAESPLTRDHSGDGDENEFQVQLTPPRLSSRRGPEKDSHHKPARGSDDSTASEDEMVPPPRISEGGTSKVRKLGGIGSLRQDPANHSAEVKQPHATHQSALQDDGSETASDADDDPTASLSGEPSSPPAAPAPTKRGLDRIGSGKPKTGPEPDLVLDNQRPVSSPEHKPSPRKLGAIGKRAIDGDVVNQSSIGDGQSSVRGRRTEASPAEQAPRETSQERADRKREELKKSLEKKAAAGPAKKKRKF